MATEPGSFSKTILVTNASVYSFLSGAFISVSVNLYTGIFSTDAVPSRWRPVLFATLLTAISSLAWAILSWRLDAVQRIFEKTKNLDDPTKTWEMLVGHKRRGLMTLFWIATFAALLGLVVLPIGVRFSEGQTQSAGTEPNAPLRPKDELKESPAPVTSP